MTRTVLQRRTTTTVALFGAEVAGVRAVIVMHGPYMIPRADISPLGTGLMPARGPLGRLRDRSAAAVALAVFRSGMPALNRVRAEAGLPSVRDLATPWELERLPADGSVE